MQMSQAHFTAVCAILIPLLIGPQLVSTTPEKRNINLRQEQSNAEDPPDLVKIQTLLRSLVLSGSQLEPRSPIETPPTEYLPYPPPPNYSWPPGPHTQNPPPSETNAPAGWYGGTGTGGQGNSGAGSASGSGYGSSTSAAAPSLRLPSLLHVPLEVVLLLLPAYLLPSSSYERRSLTGQPMKARDPVETPPTEYLPYPPPPNYQWPPGENPQNEYPQPSENNPPAGWYGGTGQGNPGAVNGNGNTGSGASNNGLQQTSSGGGGYPIGRSHLVWIVIVTIISTMIVVSIFWWWRMNKKAAGGGEEEGEKAKVDLKERMGTLKFWGKGKKEGRAPPPAAAAAAPPAEPAAEEAGEE
ncbi:MAG: hypothetical protein Q9218_001290 [Villophora microphyllina]